MPIFLNLSLYLTINTLFYKVNTIISISYIDKDFYKSMFNISLLGNLRPKQTVQFLRSCWKVNNLQPSHFEQLYLKMQLQKLVTYIYYMQLTRFNHSRLYFCLVGGRKKDNPMQLSLDIFKQSSVLHQRSSVILDDMGLLIYFQIPIKCIKM